MSRAKWFASALLVLWRPLNWFLDLVGAVDTVQGMLNPEHWVYRALFWPHLGNLMTGVGLLLLFALWRGQRLPIVVEATPSPDVGPTMDVLRWRDGEPDDVRPEYRKWVHAIFRFSSKRSERAKAFIEFRDGRRLDAHINGNGWHASEVSALDPERQYAVGVYLTIAQSTTLWIDQQSPKHGALGPLAPVALQPGTYWTDSPFMLARFRQPIPPGNHTVRVVVVLGDKSHSRSFFSDWRDVAVSGGAQANDETARRRRARERLGLVAEELAQCELAAYRGTNGEQYEELLARLAAVGDEVRRVSVECLDSSLTSRWESVNVHDSPVDDATKHHFISRAQGSFWAVYQRVRGWRKLVDGVLSELNR